MHTKFPHLFQPFQVKGVTFRNRIFSAPNQMCSFDANGLPTPDYVSYIAEKARGGAAVVTIGDTPIDREHAATNPHSFNLSREALPFLSELAMVMHEGGAVASCELNHGGLVSTPEANYGGEGWEAWGPVDFVRDWDGVHVHGMTEAELELVAERFADGAELLKTAGFDMCLVHGAHGWLLDQFTSPLWNTRTDGYGGSLENRAKFPLMVIDRIRQRCGERFLIEYRVSVSEEIQGGLSKEEGVAFAKLLDGKVDFIHCSAGLDTEEYQAVHTHPTIFLPHGVNVHYAAAVKAAGVTTPVVTVGAVSTPELAEEIISTGKADIVAMARALIADPQLPNKALMGREDEIVPCLRCLDCLTGMHTGEHFQCSVNPSAGRELRYRNYTAAPSPARKVLVVGGGPAGMKAAVTAAQRGHQVTLAEAGDKLGGLLSFTDYDSLKEDLHRLKDYLVRTVERSAVQVLLNTAVDSHFVRDGQYDAVIVATGSSPLVLPIPGMDDPKVQHATTAYTRLHELGHKVAVLGGGMVGCETALFLAEEGHDVTIVEMREEVAPDANWMHREGMMQAFAKVADRLHCRTGLKVSAIRPDGVCALDNEGQEVHIQADCVIYAFGMRSNSGLYFDLVGSAPQVVCVGDASRVGTARGALFSGYWAAVNLN